MFFFRSGTMIFFSCIWPVCFNMPAMTMGGGQAMRKEKKFWGLKLNVKFKEGKLRITVYIRKSPFKVKENVSFAKCQKHTSC